MAVGLAAKGPESLGWGKLGTIHLLDSFIRNICSLSSAPLRQDGVTWSGSVMMLLCCAGYTCIGWVASPIVGGVVSMLVFIVIKKTVHDHPEPAQRANKV